MKTLISLAILCVFGVGQNLYGEEIVVFQQGSENYSGCSWTNLIQPKSGYTGNEKYKNSITGNFLLAALYQC